MSKALVIVPFAFDPRAGHGEPAGADARRRARPGPHLRLQGRQGGSRPLRLLPRLRARRRRALRGGQDRAGRGLRRRLHRHDERLRDGAAALGARHPGDRPGAMLVPDGAHARLDVLRAHAVGSVDRASTGRASPSTGSPTSAPRSARSTCRPTSRTCSEARRRSSFRSSATRASPASSDGAEVICMGSTTMHQAVPFLREHLPVPVINPGPLTYKLAELCIGLGLSHSRRAYPSRTSRSSTCSRRCSWAPRGARRVQPHGA